MNEKLYEELKEYCNYDLKEVEKTIEYFKNRLVADTNYNCKSHLDMAIMEEIDMIIDCNYENEIDLKEEEKFEMAREIICEEDSLWEDLNCIIIDKINKILKKRLKYLEEKQKCSSLDKEELYLYGILQEIL